MPRTTNLAAERAEQIRKDQERLEGIGVRSSTAIMREMNNEIIQAFSAGVTDFTEIVRDAFLAFSENLQQGSATSDLSGRAKVVDFSKNTLAASMAFATEIVSPWLSAAEAAAAKAGVSEAEALIILQAYGPQAIEISTALAADVNAKLRVAVADIIGQNLAKPEGTALLNQTLQRAGVKSELIVDAAGKKVNQSFLLETTYRTQVNMSYSAGRWNMGKDPDIDEILWGYEYVTIMDGREREEHAALNGTRKAKDDPFWSVFFPPNGWNCRCTTIEIFNDDRNTTANEPDRVNGALPQPDPGFDFNPGEVLGV